jgi:hypothetical protein
MDDEFIRELATRCRSLAEKADDFTKRRLLDLAASYESKVGRPSRATSLLRITLDLPRGPDASPND